MWATGNLGFSQAATVPVFCVNKNYRHAKIPGRNIVKKEIYLGQGRRFVRLQTSSFLSLNPLPPRCRAGGRVRSALFLWVSVCKYSHQSWFQAGNVELRDDACSPLLQPGKESFLCITPAWGKLHSSFFMPKRIYPNTITPGYGKFWACWERGQELELINIATVAKKT